MTLDLGRLYRRGYLAINYRMRRFRPLACRPTSIVFLLTQRCNARCLHCDLWKTKDAEETPGLATLRTALADLRRWLGPVEATLTGGEALLQPYALDLLEYGVSLGLFMEFLSNGYWRDQAKVERLALAGAGRVTISFDGFGATHNKVRGLNDCFERTSAFLETLCRVRRERRLKFVIRLKTVIMRHNLQDVCEIAHFAAKSGVEVFYQPIEQNYATAEDPKWFLHTDNWPSDTARATSVVRELLRLKSTGAPIANSRGQLEVMIPYFENPDASRAAVQGHSAHERRQYCAALGMLQIQANGDVLVCSGAPPVGNIKSAPIRSIWENRPHWWEHGCCRESHCADGE
jgi:MoaA/NifB/PqqE/SkfB family radical SAM enzyme